MLATLMCLKEASVLRTKPCHPVPGELILGTQGFQRVAHPTPSQRLRLHIVERGRPPGAIFAPPTIRQAALCQVIAVLPGQPSGARSCSPLYKYPITRQSALAVACNPLSLLAQLIQIGVAYNCILGIYRSGASENLCCGGPAWKAQGPKLTIKVIAAKPSMR